MGHRRRSVDSSSSSDSSDSGSPYQRHNINKNKTKDKDHKSGSNIHTAMSEFPSPSEFDHKPESPLQYTPSHQGNEKGLFHLPHLGHSHVQQAPPSGFRIPLSTSAPFPGREQSGEPPFHDLDGVSPVFIGSALMERSVHPCKIGPHLRPFAAVPYGSTEYGHHGRYDLLPLRHDQMEFVPTSHGRIPHGRRPVDGGYEEDGNKLYHALGVVQGIKVPGKAGEHLNGCRIGFGGVEYSFEDHYEILCWK